MQSGERAMQYDDVLQHPWTQENNALKLRLPSPSDCILKHKSVLQHRAYATVKISRVRERCVSMSTSWPVDLPTKHELVLLHDKHR